MSIPGHSSNIDPFHLVSSELDVMTSSIRDTVSVLQHPALDNAASHLLSLKGKRFRPIIVLLMAHSTAALAATTPTPTSATTTSNSTNSDSPLCDTVTAHPGEPSVLPNQLRLAEITELIHAASLLHDDVIDVADTRRGRLSVNSVFGNQLAVLAGDFLLARASVALARLRHCDVVETLSTVIEHLVRGEVIQMKGGMANLSGGIGDFGCTQADDWFHRPSNLFDMYLAKTFFKTASLVANSCRAVTMLAGHSVMISDFAYRFGEDIGLAFQLVDDLLDLTGDAHALGKPVLNDLRQGVATAPVLFALDKFPVVGELIDRRFSQEGDVEHVLQLVERVQGVKKTRELAKRHVRRAVESVVEFLPPSDYRSALINLAVFVLGRER